MFTNLRKAGKKDEVVLKKSPLSGLGMFYCQSVVDGKLKIEDVPESHQATVRRHINKVRSMISDKPMTPVKDDVKQSTKENTFFMTQPQAKSNHTNSNHQQKKGWFCCCGG